MFHGVRPRISTSLLNTTRHWYVPVLTTRAAHPPPKRPTRHAYTYTNVQHVTSRLTCAPTRCTHGTQTHIHNVSPYRGQISQPPPWRQPPILSGTPTTQTANVRPTTSSCISSNVPVLARESEGCTLIPTFSLERAPPSR
ncbi:hypothetical protein PAXRUDRAFT_824508 [Paxillus rubicundulus Ve08.2h10]|uniref:Uncharacterized protein n=1 Tax=Paxillus rubicundulus Ve08.2h10 TaxID=930991 RepID=A0A0D0DHS0_9AGAM|nr:hypothetical protein PAXRUDRAFT_824508 [Paxillus rubicundulus Ve08.2h10]